MDYITLLELGASFISGFLGKLKNKLPQELLDAGVAFVDAIGLGRIWVSLHETRGFPQSQHKVHGFSVQIPQRKGDR